MPCTVGLARPSALPSRPHRARWARRRAVAARPPPARSTALCPAHRQATCEGSGLAVGRLYSVAIACRTSSLAARRDGHTAASTPTTRPASTATTSWSTGMSRTFSPSSDHRRLDGRREQHPDRQPQQGAEQRDRDRLDPEHPAQLRAIHADRPEQADLAGPLDHAEGERVDDAEDRDQDREREQHADRGERAVDRSARRGRVRLLIADLDRRVVLQLPEDQGGDRRHLGALGNFDVQDRVARRAADGLVRRERQHDRVQLTVRGRGCRRRSGGACRSW